MSDQAKSLRIVLDNGMSIETDTINIHQFEQAREEWFTGRPRGVHFIGALTPDRQCLHLVTVKTRNEVMIPMVKVAYVEQYG